jgi:hypothetical protein
MAQAVSRRPLTTKAWVAKIMWDLWWIKWHWDGFFFEFFSFPLSILFHRGSPYSHIIWEMKNRSVGGRSSERVSHHRHEQQKYYSKRRNACHKLRYVRRLASLTVSSLGSEWFQYSPFMRCYFFHGMGVQMLVFWTVTSCNMYQVISRLNKDC